MIPCHRFGLTCHFFVILGVPVCRTGLMVKCPASDFCEAISSFYIITYWKNINLGYHLISYLTLLNIDLVLYWSRKREVVAYMLAGREINMTCHLLACKIRFWGSSYMWRKLKLNEIVKKNCRVCLRSSKQKRKLKFVIWLSLNKIHETIQTLCDS